MSEKLLTLKEACEILGLEPDEMLRLVDEGRIPYFRIGGEYMRFKKSQIEALDLKPDSQSDKKRGQSPLLCFHKENRGGSPLFREGQRAGRKDSLRFDSYPDIPYTGIDRIKDFWYFNDVYIISIIIIITVLFLVFR